MMNRIKQYALFALLLVPAVAQASARVEASAGADEKHLAEAKSLGGRYLRMIENTDQEVARKDFADLMSAKKKKNTVNCLSAWYKNNKALAGAIVGATIWGGTAALSGYAEGRDASTIARSCAMPAIVGSMTGALAGASGNLGKYALGSAIGGTAGYLQGRSSPRLAATREYGFAGNAIGALLGTRLENTSSAASGSIAMSAGFAYGYGTAFAPVALPALAGAFIGDYRGFYNQMKTETAEIAVQTDAPLKDETLSSHVRFEQ